jgi:hypothetical protein
MTKRYYVYVYLDPEKENESSYNVNNIQYKFNNDPIYIGQGCFTDTGKNKYDRIYDHFYKMRSLENPIYIRLKELIKIGYSKDILKAHYIIKLSENLSKSEALELESKFIKALGRKDLGTGTLLNQNDGYKNVSEEVRNRISKSRTGKGTGSKNYMYNKGYLLSGKNNPYYGKKHTDDVKSNMRRTYIFTNVLECKEYVVHDREEFCKEHGPNSAVMYRTSDSYLYKGAWKCRKQE